MWKPIKTKAVNRWRTDITMAERKRTDNTMADRKSTKGQTTIQKTLHWKLNFQQHEPQ